MPIEFVHFLSGVIVVGALALLLRQRLNQPFVYLWSIFVFMLPDVDHFLFWNPEMLQGLFPRTLQDLYIELLSNRHPLYLHSWLFPAAIAAIAVYGRKRGFKHLKYVEVLALGWAVHLILDGVVLA